MECSNTPSPAFVDNLPVIITGLGAITTSVPGQILEMTPTTMSLRAASPLTTGTPVKIEAQDDLWLGEIARCEEDAGDLRLTVTLAHALHGLSDLARLAERFGVRSVRDNSGVPRTKAERAAEPTTVAGT